MNAQRKFVHDMKNQLGIIIGYSNLLLDEMLPDDARRTDVDEIRKAGDGALKLLNTFNTAPADEDVK